MCLELASQEAPRAAGAARMERSGCSPFPLCWAEGTGSLGVWAVSVWLEFMLLH